MNGLLKDIRFVLRSLLQAPGFSLVSILTLGLGLGMSVAVYSIVDAVLMDALPYPDADHLLHASGQGWVAIGSTGLDTAVARVAG